VLLAKGVMGKTWAKLQQAVSSETLFGAQDTKPAAPAGKADPLAEFEVPLPSLPVDSKWKPSWVSSLRLDLGDVIANRTV
jgi:hypothetical protein